MQSDIQTGHKSLHNLQATTIVLSLCYSSRKLGALTKVKPLGLKI